LCIFVENFKTNQQMSVQEWGWIDDPEQEVEHTCKMCDEPISKEGYCSTECFEADIDDE
jgi:hypothetical protein